MSELEGIINISNLQAAVQNLPTSLDAMYEATVIRISALSDAERSLAHQAFTWVMHAERTLEIRELLHALVVDSESIDFNEGMLTTEEILTSACCGLITMEQGTNEVRLIRAYQVAALTFEILTLIGFRLYNL